jgi:hypothetical protein
MLLSYVYSKSWEDLSAIDQVVSADSLCQKVRAVEVMFVVRRQGSYCL